MLNWIALSVSLTSLALSIYLFISWRKQGYLDPEDLFDALLEQNDGTSDTEYMFDDEPTDRD